MFSKVLNIRNFQNQSRKIRKILLTQNKKKSISDHLFLKS